MTGMSWPQIVRLGFVQFAIGAMAMLATSLLNRVMVVELALAAAVPAGLVAWHYVVQLSRPLWGHGSDSGRRRTPWIIGGMGVLGMGTMLAVDATAVIGSNFAMGLTLAIVAFALIGAGVGAAGTSLLALLATHVAHERRAAAAAITWILMVAGIIVAAGTAGSLLEPFSIQRLAQVAGGVVLVAFLVALVAVAGVEDAQTTPKPSPTAAPPADFREALAEIRGDAEARRFTLFVFVSMLAYSMQDLILEPFAGLVFAMSPAASTKLSGLQHSGVLIGMILAGLGGSAFAGRRPGDLRPWITFGCVASALALGGLAMAAEVGPGWPIAANVALLGFANGVFAVSAIGAMMGLAGAGTRAREGMRMGIWGAAQAIAFGLGGVIGAVGVDIMRAITGATAPSFQLIFAAEAVLFLGAAIMAARPPAASRAVMGPAS
ncbi:MAG: BCD family MFS transporter [Alphaproteobacteria bacterium]|nr:BCD family MFS transporter [Alphaproteobacteria bacterium]